MARFYGVKLSFIFTHCLTLDETPSGERVTSSIDLPIEVKERPDLRERILAAAANAAYFTRFSLFVHCPEAGLQYHPVVQRESPRDGVWASEDALGLYFQRNSVRFLGKMRLYIYAPIDSPFSRFHPPQYDYRDWFSEADKEYVSHIRALVESVLDLLNSDPKVSPNLMWRLVRFDPRELRYPQAKHLEKLYKKRKRAAAAAEKQQKQLEEKRAKQAARAAERSTSDGPTKHGGGRVPGARPGIYNGIQMRSQLEIRFASELDERKIKWIYEGEAVGAASYLVDFYLPDLGVWVEVKGRFEARDRQVLPKVARFLKMERKQRLLVYTGSGKCCVVNPSGFREIERKNFWSEVFR